MSIIQITSNEQWHALRATHIGGSDTAALFAEKREDSPFVSLHELWSRMRGLLPGKEQSPIMEFGNDMEPVIAKWLDKTYQLDRLKSDEYHEHPEMYWLGTTLDYYSLGYLAEGAENPVPAITEIKHVSGEWVKGWSQVKCPTYIELQMQHQIFTTNAARRELGLTPFEWILCGAMIGGNPEDLRLYPRKEIPEITQAIAERSTAFYKECIRGDKEPEISTAGEFDHIREMFLRAKIEEEILDLTADSEQLEEWMHQWKEAKNAVKFHEDRKNLLRRRLMRACLVIDEDDVTGHTIGRTDNYDIVLRKGTQNRGGVVSDTLGFDVRERKP